MNFKKIKFPAFFDTPDWENPRFVFLLTVVSYFLLVIIRFAVFSLFTEAVAVGDDYTYKGMAFSFFKTGDFHELNYARKLILPNYLYPLALSPAFFIMEHFYIFMKLINSLLINALIFPVFLMAKEFMSYKKAYVIAIIAAFIPFVNIGYMLMAEVLYLPLFLSAFYVCYKLLTGLKLKYAVLSGVMLGLLYSAKPHALFFIAAFLATAAIIVMSEKDKKEKKKMLYLTAGALVCTALSVIILNMAILGNPGLELNHYSRVAKKSMDFSKKPATVSNPKLFYLMLSHVSLFLMVYLLPFFTAVFSLIKAVKEKARDKAVILLLCLTFSLVMMAVIFFLALRHPIYTTQLRLPARFYFMIYPVYIIAFAAFYKYIDWNKRQKIIMTITFALTLAANVFVFIPKIVSAQPGFAMIINMDAVWIYLSRLSWGNIGSLLFFLVQITGLAVLIHYFTRKRKTVYPYFIFFLLVTIIANYGMMQRMSVKNKWRLNYRKNFYSFVSEKIPPHSRDVAIISYKPHNRWGYFSFWLHFDYTTQLRLKQHQTIERKMIPDNTRWVLVEGDYKIGFPVKKRYTKKEFSILRMREKRRKAGYGRRKKDVPGDGLSSKKGDRPATKSK